MSMEFKVKLKTSTAFFNMLAKIQQIEMTNSR